MTTKTTICDYEAAKRAQQCLIEVASELKILYKLEKDEIKSQLDVLDKLWEQAQRFAILTNGAPGVSLYPRNIAHVVKGEIFEEFNRLLKKIRDSNCKLDEMLAELTPFYVKLSKIAEEIDWTVHSGPVVGDEVFKPLHCYVEDVVDIRNSFKQGAVGRRAQELMINIYNVAAIDEYKEFLKEREISLSTLAKKLCFATLLMHY